MKDKIRLIYNKIENRIDEICDDGFVLKENQQEYETLTDLEDFIDSLPEQPISEDLEEEYDNYFKKHEVNIVLNPYTNCKDIARHFAEWQKQKALQDFLEKAMEYFKGKPIHHFWVEDFKNYMEEEL